MYEERVYRIEAAEKKKKSDRVEKDRKNECNGAEEKTNREGLEWEIFMF